LCRNYWIRFLYNLTYTSPIKWTAKFSTTFLRATSDNILSTLLAKQ
jgi:hypothetical protein